MTNQQTASISLHPPVIAGVSTGGERSGFFDPMETPTPTPGTLDWYREVGKTNPDIAALVAMIDKQSSVITSALGQLAVERAKNKQEAA